MKEPNGYSLCLDLSDDDLNRLLRLQGWSGEYLLMISLAICKNNNIDPEVTAKSLLNKLMKNMYVLDEESTV